MWELLVFLPFAITPGKLKTYMVKKTHVISFFLKRLLIIYEELEILDAEVYMRCIMIETFINVRTCTPSVSCLILQC